MTLAQLEIRLATLERKLAAMAGQKKVPPATDVNAWIDEIHGTFKDNESYRQAARLGRKWRKAQRPVATRVRKTSPK